MNLGDKIQFITVYKYLPCLMTIEILLVFILKFMASCFLFIFHLEFIWMCGIFFGGGIHTESAQVIQKYLNVKE